MKAVQAGLQKQPTKARSRARVAAITSATAELLGEIGYDGLTTNLIAERAGVPVGTLYQFFRDKDDIVAELVARFKERIMGLVHEQLNAETLKRDRAAFVAALVEGIGRIQEENSAFVCIFSANQTNARFDDLGRELRQTLSRHLDHAFAAAFPTLDAAERRRMLATWADITGAMVSNFDRSIPGERKKLGNELKTVLGAYLDAKLGGAAAISDSQKK